MGGLSSFFRNVKGVVKDVTGATAAEEASAQQVAGTDAALAEQRRQFDVTQESFQPFREAGVGALGQFQQGMGQQPAIPQLQQFQGQAVGAPTLNRFQGQAPQFQTSIGGQQVGQFDTQAPQLEQFRFDPNKALESPAMQFQREMGNQTLARQAGKNRQLGSGNRLIAAQQFGQGLASQSLGDEFQRQMAGVNQRNLASQQGFGNEAQRAQLRGQLQGQQFGQDLSSAQFGNQAQQLGFQNQLGLNQLGNQQAIQQQGLQRQQLSDEQALAQAEQNRLLTQFGLTQDQRNQRLNRLAGLVDVGRNATSSLAQAGGQASGNIANLLQARAGSQAAGTLGSAGALRSGIVQGIGAAYGIPPTGGNFVPSGGV